METFQLQYLITTFKNLQCEVELKPLSNLISDKFATYVVYDNYDEAFADIGRLISEYTPLMYTTLQEDENISTEVKSLFTL